MWNVMPKSTMLKFLLYVFSVGLLLMFQSVSWDDISANRIVEIIRLITPTILIFMALLFLIGKWGWKVLWRAPLLGDLLNQHLCPDLNGDWNVELTPFGDETNKAVVTMKVMADFFTFRMELVDSDNETEILTCDYSKEVSSGSFVLTYVFQGRTFAATDTDESVYLGSARMRVAFNNGSTSMKGHYWTNRGWMQKENRAGVVTFSQK